MPAPRCRPFTVLDGMILVAATAVGLWLGRQIDWPDLESDPVNFGLGSLHGRTFDAVHARLTSVA